MKKLLIFLLLSVGLNAQFNYQALVKHSSGGVISNNQVKIKFSLMYYSSTATPVFIEEHDITIPDDGVVNLSVGGGTVLDGTFSDLDWSRSVFMKEELDTGSGYQDMGTNRILAVPVAEYAKETENLSFYGSQNAHIGTGSNPYLGLVTNTISIGGMSGVFSNGSDNVFAGRLAGMQIKGSENVGIGNNSMIGGFDVNPQNANNNEVSKYNTAIGFNSLRSVDGGDYNTAVGWNSLNSNTSGYNNIAIGTDALSRNVSGTDNLAIGNGALFQNLGQRNLAVGASSLENNTSGTINTSVGFQSMQFNQTGANNTAIGDSSLYSNTEGDFNVAVGRSSLLDNIDGEGNTAIGDSAGYRNESGSFNTSLGMMSFFSLESGNDNVAVGAYSGSGTTTNTNIFTETTFVGAYSGGVNGVQNSTAIGANSIVTSSNTIQLGDSNVTQINTSGVVSATDFILSGDSVGNILGSLSSTQSDIVALSTQVDALLAVVDDLDIQTNSLSSTLSESNTSEIKSAQVRINSNDVVLFELGVLRFSWNNTYNTIQVKQSSTSEIIDNWFISGVIRSGGSDGEYTPTEKYIQKTNMTYGIGDDGGGNDFFTPIWNNGTSSLMEGSIALGSGYSNFEFYITPMGSGSTSLYDPAPTWQLRGHVDGYNQLTVTCVHVKFDGTSGW